MNPSRKQPRSLEATHLHAAILLLLTMAPVLPAQPNVRIEGYAAGEAAAPPTCGTSGYVLPGQQVELLIKLYNDDLANAVTGISGTLTLLNQETINGEPLISWSNATDTWPDLAALLADCNQAGFALQIHREIPCHYRLNFRLALTTDQGATNLLFSVPIGELSSCPHVDLPDHRITSDPGDSSAPAIALGPNLYGVVWQDNPGVNGLYFSAYDRFFAQVVGPRLIQAGSLFHPDLLYNPRTDRFICVFEQNGWIQIASFDRMGGSLSIQVTSDTGSNPRVAWNPSGRIGVVYTDGSGTHAFVERDDVYPFGNPIYAPSMPTPALGSHDVAYDPGRDQYFIVYEKYDVVGSKNDVYYTTYSTTNGYSLTCPPDTCRVEYAKEPAVVVRGDEYALAWEQDSPFGPCSAQVHEIHLRLMDFTLAQIHPNYDDMVVSDPTDLHGAYDPLLAWSESADRYILHWMEDTCQTNQDGMNLDAIWQRTLNRNRPVGTVSFDPPCLVEDGLLYQGSDSRLRGRFDRERSLMTWGDHRIDPRGGNYEIFANHAFNAHPHAFVPEGNETPLLLPNEAGDDIVSASDGNLFWTSIAEGNFNSLHLLFSLYDQSLAVQNGKERIRVDSGGGVKNHSVVYDAANDAYAVTWWQQLVSLSPSSTPTAPIPDNDPAGVTDSIQVIDDQVVSSITVLVDITHPDDGDLTLSLIGPTGTEVVLSQKHGAGGADYSWTTFDDSAGTPIGSGTPPFTGSFQPDNPLGVFTGGSTLGTWTLKVADDTTGNVGTLTDWTLNFTLVSSDGLFLRHVDATGSFLDSPTQVLATTNSLDRLATDINPSGTLQATAFSNTTAAELQFYSYPSGTPVPVTIDTGTFYDWSIAYNDSGGPRQGWGVLWSKEDPVSGYDVRFAVVDDAGIVLTGPITLENVTAIPNVALVWDGFHYQAYHSGAPGELRAFLLDPDGTLVVFQPFAHYGDSELEALFTGAETIVYWAHPVGSDNAYLFSIFDNSLHPLSENIEIYSMRIPMTSTRTISMAAATRKIFAAYAEEAASFGSTYYGQTLDIFGDILTCTQVRNRPPSANAGGPYSAAFSCPGTCITLDGTGSTSASPPPAEDLGDSIALYEWDLNQDAAFDINCTASTSGTDATGATVGLTQAELESVGIDTPGNYPVWLRVTDEGGANDCASSTISITDGQAPVVTVVTPNGGESWDYSPDSSNRRVHQIVWNVSENFPEVPGTITIDYTTDGTTWTPIATLAQAPGSGGNYDWSMPTQAEAAGNGQTFPSAHAKIRVTVKDGSNNSGQDASDGDFYIIQPTATAVRTLILTHTTRTDTYDPGTSGALYSKLTELANHAKVSGVVLDLKNVPGLDPLYATWDGIDPSVDPAGNIAAANAVADAIRSYITTQVGSTYTNARYLVLAGDDRIIPHYRVADGTATYPESNYAAQVNCNNALGAAICNDYYFTDNTFGDVTYDTTSVGSNFLAMPDLATGRLVETSAEMEATIDTFIAQDGQVTLSKTLITGYDFLVDSATTIDSRYTSAGKTTTSHIGSGWNAATLETDLFASPAHQLNNLNDHSNHFTFGTPSGLLDTTQMETHSGRPLEGVLFYNVGCHSGLVVPDDSGFAVTLDLPQEILRRGAAGYLGNSGFGWGLRYGEGYSERLMELITDRILGASSIALGYAVNEARRDYYLEDHRYDVFDEKVLMQSTFYGLPMYQIVVTAPFRREPKPELSAEGPDHQVADGIVMDKRLIPPALPAGLTQLDLAFDFSAPGVYQTVNTPDGDYYTLNGKSSGEIADALQPLFKFDSRLSGTVSHGVLFTGGAFVQQAAFNPVVGAPASNNPPLGEGPIAPMQPTFLPIMGITNPLTPTSLLLTDLTQLTAYTGYLDTGTSIERRFNMMDFTIYYSNSIDRTAPVITDPGPGGDLHTLSGLDCTFSVPVSDASGIHRVVVVYTDGASDWKSLDLSYDSGSGNWIGMLTLKKSIGYHVQAVDKAGNIGYLTDSGADIDANGMPTGSSWTAPRIFSATLADCDSDGMPDAWESANGLQVCVADDTGDPDLDLYTNIEEFGSDTDPQDADTDGDGDNDGSEAHNGRLALDGSDGLDFTLMVTQVGNDLVLDWNDTLGTNGQMDGPYWLYRSLDPFFDDTELLVTAPQPLPDGTTTYTDVGAGLGPTYYYRVVNARYALPAPTVAAVVPNNGPASGGTAITVYGANFVTGATVDIDGNAATNVVFVNSTTITCTTPAGAVGPRDVKVTNPNGQNGILAGGFTYN